MSAGRVSWPSGQPLWEFDWRLMGGAETEGIVFTNVRYKGHLVLFKASLPMIRVQYDSVLQVGPFRIYQDTGPYKDTLSADNATRDVRVSEAAGQLRFLVVESAHRIGHYRLTNRWIFREDGGIHPQLFSAGLQSPADHRHHVYWRFDFDIDGADSDLALYGAESWPQSWGWGPGWQPIVREYHARRGADSKFAVLDTKTQRGYQLLAGPNDGTADTFSDLDYAVHRYRDSDDHHGQLGTPSDDQVWRLPKIGSTESTDIVVWYCAHLAHAASDGGDEWHVCGPILEPFGF